MLWIAVHATSYVHIVMALIVLLAMQICDAVAVAGLLNATLVIPIFHLNSVWRDSRYLIMLAFNICNMIMVVVYICLIYSCLTSVIAVALQAN